MAVLVGCPSDNEPTDDEVGETQSETETGTDDDTDSSTDGETGTLECDVPQMFEDKCGGESCHGGGGSSAAGLDLVSAGVDKRVSGIPGNNCAGLLADPADPEGSVLYTKVTDPGCGVLMPIGGDPLSEDEVTCLEAWISGLLPPDGECEDCICEPGVEESCYTGPDGTADVGICQSGTRTCLTSGMAWTDCDGEALPIGENCTTEDVDENCDGETPACSDIWALRFGDEEDQAMRSVAVDAEGNVWGFGQFEGTVSFGGEPHEATFSRPQKPDLIITKHDTYGNYLSSQRFGDNSTQQGVSMVIDDDGGMHFLVRMYGTCDVGGGLLDAIGGAEAMAFKFDSEGNHVWSSLFGGPDADRAERIAYDSQGNSIITGTFTDWGQFGDTMMTSQGLRDAFVVKVDGETGEVLFALQVSGVEDVYGFGVAVADNDDIFISGRFQGDIDIGNDTLVSAGERDIYLARLSSAGVPQWAERFGGPGEDEVHDIAMQSNGDVVMLGAISDTVNLGGGALVSAGSRDLFLATFDSSGDHVWSHSWGDAGDQLETGGTDTFMSVDVSDDGDILFTGSLYGTLNFGGANVLTSAGDGGKPDVFYAHFNQAGQYLGGQRYGGIGTDNTHDVAFSNEGQVIVVGRSSGSQLDFGSAGLLVNDERTDAYIAKLPL